MILENKICHIEITADETYTVGSAGNRHYDVTLNPDHYQCNDYTKTFSIYVDLHSREYRIAMIGSHLSDAQDCAVLEGHILTVLQDDMITQINITDASVIRSAVLDCFGSNFALYKVQKGYVIYGECEITMLDSDLRKQWSFSGRDIFVSISGKEAFTICENSICLYDFEDNYYEIDFDGKQIR